MSGAAKQISTARARENEQKKRRKAAEEEADAIRKVILAMRPPVMDEYWRRCLKISQAYTFSRGWSGVLQPPYALLSRFSWASLHLWFMFLRQPLLTSHKI